MKKLMIAALAMTALGAADLHGQASQTGNATVNIPQVLAITAASDLTIAETAFDLVNNATSTASATVTVDTRGNVLHDVEVTGAALTLTGSNDLNLQVLDSGGSYAPVSATSVVALDALPRGVNAGETITFQTTADLSLHGPGAYTGTITYTVVAN